MEAAAVPGPVAAEPARSGFRFELAMAVLLGLTALATAWAAYQASLSDGDSILNFNLAIRKVDEASQQWNEGNQIYVQDQQVFLEYMKAVAADNTDLALYVRETLMSPGLISALEWWETTPDDGPATPFVEENPSWVNASYDNAVALEAEAEGLFATAKDFDRTGDRYTLVTVILAAALFMFGIGSVGHHRAVRLGTLVIGTVVLGAGIVEIVRITSG
jgi:hypothetical protein